MRYTVAVDFDGVIHSYTSPWVSEDMIPDPPVPGAIEALNRLAQDFDVVIHTTRGKSDDGVHAVRAYLVAHGCTFGTYAVVTDKKVPALVYIDDRAYRFTGDNWPTARQIHSLRPWNKEAPHAAREQQECERRGERGEARERAASVVARLAALAGPEGAPETPATLETLGCDIVAWGAATFGAATNHSRVAHMVEEVIELAKQPDDLEEMADIFHLLVQCAGSPEGLRDAVAAKFAKNQRRTWGQPDANGVVKHIEEGA